MHCAYIPSERVGLAIATHDTPGSSKPSVSTATLAITRVRPARKSASAVARSALAIAPCTMPAGTPIAFSARDTLRA